MDKVCRTFVDKEYFMDSLSASSTNSRLFKILFQDDEHIYTGSAYGVEPTPISEIDFEYNNNEEFFCINPVLGSRSDLNVTALRNFLFEIDTLPLTDQKLLLEPLKPYFASITYSGGKSYHAIISLETPLSGAGTADGVATYKQTWKALAAALETKMGDKAQFDTACQNPSRLSRTPGFVRDNGNLQSLEYIGSFISPETLTALIGGIPKPRHAMPVAEKIHENFGNDITKLKNFMPVELYNRLRYPSAWAAPAGLYPELLKLVLWTIDSTGASKEIVLEFMQKYTFPGLIRAGYPRDKLLKPINHAFAIKAREHK